MKKELPKTVEEAVQQLLKEMHLDGKNYIGSMTMEKELYDVHHSLGRAIRNNMGLWGGNSVLLINCKRVALENGQQLTPIRADHGEFFAMHPDDASHTILVELWKKLRRPK